MFRQLTDAVKGVTDSKPPTPIKNYIDYDISLVYYGLLQHHPRRLSRMIREIEVEATK